MKERSMKRLKHARTQTPAAICALSLSLTLIFGVVFVPHFTVSLPLRKAAAMHNLGVRRLRPSARVAETGRTRSSEH